MCSGLGVCMQGLGDRSQANGAASSSDTSTHRLASVKEEASARAALVVAALQALAELREDAFRQNLAKLFPRLTRMIACRHASPEIHAVLSDLFASRIGSLLSAS